LVRFPGVSQGANDLNCLKVSTTLSFTGISSFHSLFASENEIQ